MEKIGKYKITEILGKGAMGIVYKALDPDINREVAIKTIRFDVISEGDNKEEMMERFMREAQAVGKLSHSNIITIFDVAREEDTTYIVMQYVEGQSLQQMIGSKKKLSSQEVVELMKPLSEALDYAHKNGIVHRDIKPANILIDKTGRPFVVDFGVARIETSTMTQTGTTLGTPSYMSPEQVTGEKVDSRSDIFSLGVILFELLTGKRPFTGDNVSSIIYKIVNESPPHITEIDKEIPEGFEHVIKKAMAKDPKNRYQTCKELVVDLQDPTQVSDQTLTLDMTQEELAGLKKAKKPKLAFIAAFVGAIIIVGGGGAWFLTQKSKKASSSPSEKQEVKAAQSSTLTPPKATVTNPIEDKLNKVKESFDSEDYEETIRLAEEILAVEVDNSSAQDYLNKAKGKMNEAEIAPILAAGIESYNRKEFQQCIVRMQEVLKLDKDHKEAQRYFYLADTSISRRVIEQIVESQRKAEEEEDLLSLLSHIGSPTLSGQLKEEKTLFFNGYDNIKSNVSGIAIKFRNRRQATVNFSHLLTAVVKQTGQNRVLFEGARTWTLEKSRNTWKIMDIK